MQYARFADGRFSLKMLMMTCVVDNLALRKLVDSFLCSLPLHTYRILCRLRGQRFHAWPVLERVLLGIHFGFHREEARDHRSAIGHRGAVADVRSIHNLLARHFVKVRK